MLAAAAAAAAGCFLLQAMVENNSLPIVYKKELPVKIGLLPHTATSGEEVCGWGRGGACYKRFEAREECSEGFDRNQVGSR
jgi:hypothetical protein